MQLFVAVFFVFVVIVCLILQIKLSYKIKVDSAEQAEQPENTNKSVSSHLLLRLRGRTFLKSFFTFAIFMLSFSLLYGMFWAKNRFDMDDVYSVYYTLANPVGGAEQDIFSEAVTIASISFAVAFCYVCLPLLIRKLFHRNFLTLNFFKKQISCKLTSFFLAVSSAFLLYVFLCLVFVLHGVSHFSFLMNNIMKPIDSKFFKDEYVEPRYDNIVFPESKKNLIVVLLESMESSFAANTEGGMFDETLIPHLTSLARKNINFSETDFIGGGKDLAGTSWTIAAMTSKFAGLPYHLPSTNFKRKTFLPNAITLTDVLAYNGYTQRFLFGSKKYFGDRDLLLEQHGDVEIHDVTWYKENDMLPKNYEVFWGFEDEKLYEFAKQELDELSANGKPFFMGFLTVDTHMPEGYVCSLCKQTPNEKWQMKDIIRCADRQIADFLQWAETQRWYDDTVIVLMGDHLFMTGDKTNFFIDVAGGGKRADRHWLDVFINAQPRHDNATTTTNRKFSSLDMFPTILSALGCKIKNNKLAFGVDLFSDEKTLCERYDIDYLNSELMKNSVQYRVLVGKQTGRE